MFILLSQQFSNLIFETFNYRPKVIYVVCGETFPEFVVFELCFYMTDIELENEKKWI